MHVQILHCKIFLCRLVAQSCPTLCNPMDCSPPGFAVLYHLLEFAQTHVRWVSDAIKPSCPLLSPSPPALNLSQHQGLFQRVSSLHQVAEILELQLQHQSFQQILRVDFLVPNFFEFIYPFAWKMFLLFNVIIQHYYTVSKFLCEPPSIW